MPNAAKVRHIQSHPRVSLNLESDGNGSGIIAVGDVAAIDAVDMGPRDDARYWAKCKSDVERFACTEAISAYSTRLRTTVYNVWTTPTEG
jgi:PPOX class probable F420-dependent enzyme